MNAKTTIRKILFIAVWLCIGGGMFTLLLAAITKKNRGLCRDYHIVIKGAYRNVSADCQQDYSGCAFVDKNDIEQLLIETVNGTIKDRPVSSFNLHELEQMLERNTWIEDAELYFDNRDILHVTVREKIPVARIFTSAGNSFYIDSIGRQLPLSDKRSARVPVFTGFPDKKSMTAKDSLLLGEVKGMANFIVNHPFWSSQVAQVDITPGRKFEMIPLVGRHIVLLGNGENIELKFRRLYIFYKQVLAKTGFDKYKVINVQFNGQVVVSNKLADSNIDTARLRKNMESLLRQAREAQHDTVTSAAPVAGSYKLDADSVQLSADDLPVSEPLKPVQPVNQNKAEPESNNKELKTDNKPKQPVQQKRKQ